MSLPWCRISGHLRSQWRGQIRITGAWVGLISGLVMVSCSPLPRFTGPLADLANRVVRRLALRACSEIPAESNSTILQQGHGPIRNCVQQQGDSLVGVYFDAVGRVLLLTLSVPARDSSALATIYRIHRDSLVQQLGVARFCPTSSDSSFSNYEYWRSGPGFVRLYKSPGPSVTWQHGLGTGFCD